MRGLIADSGVIIELRQSKYLNNLVEQDHRAIKRRIRPMQGFKSFWPAARIIAGIETMYMIKKGQLSCSAGLTVSDADRFYSLATRSAILKLESSRLDGLIATEPLKMQWGHASFSPDGLLRQNPMLRPRTRSVTMPRRSVESCMDK